MTRLNSAAHGYSDAPALDAAAFKVALESAEYQVDRLYPILRDVENKLDGEVRLETAKVLESIVNSVHAQATDHVGREEVVTKPLSAAEAKVIIKSAAVTCLLDPILTEPAIVAVKQYRSQGYGGASWEAEQKKEVKRMSRAKLVKKEVKAQAKAAKEEKRWSAVAEQARREERIKRSKPVMDLGVKPKSVTDGARVRSKDLMDLLEKLEDHLFQLSKVRRKKSLINAYKGADKRRAYGLLQRQKRQQQQQQQQEEEEEEEEEEKEEEEAGQLHEEGGGTEGMKEGPPQPENQGRCPDRTDAVADAAAAVVVGGLDRPARTHPVVCVSASPLRAGTACCASHRLQEQEEGSDAYGEKEAPQQQQEEQVGHPAGMDVVVLAATAASVRDAALADPTPGSARPSVAGTACSSTGAGTASYAAHHQQQQLECLLHLVCSVSDMGSSTPSPPTPPAAPASVGLLSSLPPLTLNNPDNKCFMNMVFQVLFAIPETLRALLAGPREGMEEKLARVCREVQILFNSLGKGGAEGKLSIGSVVEALEMAFPAPEVMGAGDWDWKIPQAPDEFLSRFIVYGGLEWSATTDFAGMFESRVTTEMRLEGCPHVQDSSFKIVEKVLVKVGTEETDLATRIREDVLETCDVMMREDCCFEVECMDVLDNMVLRKQYQKKHFSKLPSVLVVQIEHTMGPEDGGRFYFPMVSDMAPFTEEGGREGGREGMYELLGVISIQGKLATRGHNIGFVRREGKWWELGDNRSAPFDPETQAVTRWYTGAFGDRPCTLFYRRRVDKEGEKKESEGLEEEWEEGGREGGEGGEGGSDEKEGRGTGDGAAPREEGKKGGKEGGGDGGKKGERKGRKRHGKDGGGQVDDADGSHGGDDMFDSLGQQEEGGREGGGKGGSVQEEGQDDDAGTDGGAAHGSLDDLQGEGGREGGNDGGREEGKKGRRRQRREKGKSRADGDAAPDGDDGMGEVQIITQEKGGAARIVATREGEECEALPPDCSAMGGTSPPACRQEGLSPGHSLSNGVDGLPPGSASSPRWEPVDTSASASNDSNASEAAASRDGQEGIGDGREEEESDSGTGKGGGGGNGDSCERVCGCERLPTREMHFPHQWANARVQRCAQSTASDQVLVTAGPNGRWACPFCGEASTCDCRMLGHASVCGGQGSPRASEAMPWTMSAFGLAPSSARSSSGTPLLQCGPCRLPVEWEGDNLDRHLRSCHLRFHKIDSRARDIILTDAGERFTEMGLLLNPPVAVTVLDSPPSLLSLKLLVDLELGLCACIECPSLHDDLNDLTTHLWSVPAHQWGAIPDADRIRVLEELDILWDSIPRPASVPHWEDDGAESSEEDEEDDFDEDEDDEYAEEEEEEGEEDEEGEDGEGEEVGGANRGRKRGGRRRKEPMEGKRMRGALFLQGQGTSETGVSAPSYGKLIAANQSMAHYDIEAKSLASFFQLPLEKTQLATTALFHAHGLAVNLDAEVIVCIPCKSFLSFGDVAKHLTERKEFHTAYGMTENKQKSLFAALGAFGKYCGVNLESDLVSIVRPKVLVSRLEDNVHEPFEGLPIENGIMCRPCADAWRKKGMEEAQQVHEGDFIYKQWKSFRNNHKVDHSAVIKDPTSDYHVAGAVNEKNGKGKVFEEVSYQTLTTDSSFPQIRQPVKVRVLPALVATVLAVSGPALPGTHSLAAQLALRLSAGIEGASGGGGCEKKEEDNRAFSAIHNKMKVVDWIKDNHGNLARLKALTAPAGSWAMSARCLGRTEVALVRLLKVYLEDANSRFADVPYSTAQRINSVDIETARDTHPLKPHIPRTVTSYAGKAIGLALQVLRQGLWSSVIRPDLASRATEGAGAVDEGEVAAWDAFLQGLSSLTEAARRASHDFHQAVVAHWAVPGACADGLKEHACTLVHPLLDAVFNRVMSHKVPLMACPMQQFLLIDCYSVKGGFINPASLTKVCSAFKFAAKAWAVIALYAKDTDPPLVMPFVRKEMKDSLQLESTPFWEMVLMGNLVLGATSSTSIIPTVVPLESDPTKMSYMVTLSGRSLLLDFNLHIRGIQAAIDEAIRLSLRLYQGAPVQLLAAMQIAPFLARRIHNHPAEDDPLTFLEELRQCGVEPTTFTARDRPYEVADCSGSPSINEYFGNNAKNKEMMTMQSLIVLGIGENSVEIRDTKTSGVASKSVRVDETKGWYHRDAAGNQVRITRVR